MYDLARVSWVGLYYTDPARHFTPTYIGSINIIDFLDDLDRDLSDVCRIAKLFPVPWRILLFGTGLPFGLFMTVVGGGELFTGNTAMVTAAAIEGKASTGGLLKNWVSSYLGNFLGYVSYFEHISSEKRLGYFCCLFW